MRRDREEERVRVGGVMDGEDEEDDEKEVTKVGDDGYWRRREGGQA